MTDEEIIKQVQAIRDAANEVLAGGKDACTKFLIDAGIIKPPKQSLNSVWNAILFSERPEYVKSIKSITDSVRGDKLEHEAGKVFKVSTHGKTMTLERTLRWQRYSYNDFIPATEKEYNEYHSNLTENQLRNSGQAERGNDY